MWLFGTYLRIKICVLDHFRFIQVLLLHYFKNDRKATVVFELPTNTFCLFLCLSLYSYTLMTNALSGNINISFNDLSEDLVIKFSCQWKNYMKWSLILRTNFEILKRVTKQKDVFRLVTSVGQRENSESPWEIKPQTFEIRTPMLSNWASATPRWARSVMKFIKLYKAFANSEPENLRIKFYPRR